MEVEVLPLRIKVPSLLPLFAVVLLVVGAVSAAVCAPRSSDLVGFCALRVAGEAMVLAACAGAPVLRACLRRSGTFPSVAAGLVSGCVGGLCASSSSSWLFGDGGDGSSDSSLTQGWCKDGGGFGFARSWIGSAVADVRSPLQVPASSSGDSCVLKAWWCSPSQVLRRLAFFFFSGVAGGGGRQVVWWISVAVALVLCIRLYMPAYVCCIVLPFL